MRRSCMGTRDGSHARTPSLVQTRPSLARPRRVDAHSPSCAQTSSRSDMTKKNRYSRKRRKAIRRQRGFPSDDANIIGRTRSRESVSERGAPTRSSLARTRDARTTSPPSQPRTLDHAFPRPPAPPRPPPRAHPRRRGRQARQAPPLEALGQEPRRPPRSLRRRGRHQVRRLVRRLQEPRRRQQRRRQAPGRHVPHGHRRRQRRFPGLVALQELAQGVLVG